MRAVAVRKAGGGALGSGHEPGRQGGKGATPCSQVGESGGKDCERGGSGDQVDRRVREVDPVGTGVRRGGGRPECGHGVWCWGVSQKGLPRCI